MPSVVMPILLLVATVMGVGMVVPQVVHLHRHRQAAGLSAVWIGVSLAMNAWWVAYALAEELWGLLPVSVGALVLYGVMAAQLSHLRPAARLPLAAGAVGLAWIPAVCLAYGGWTMAGLAMGLAYALQFSPAVVAALRTSDLGGVSRLTWRMAWIEAVIWFAYGLREGDPALVVGGGGGAVMATLLLSRLAQVRAPQPVVAGVGTLVD
jgi:uncharacterized protein with PQ loop repeat